MMVSFCQNKMAKGDVCKGDTGAARGGMTNDEIGMTRECRSSNDEGVLRGWGVRRRSRIGDREWKGGAVGSFRQKNGRAGAEKGRWRVAGAVLGSGRWVRLGIVSCPLSVVSCNRLWG